VRLCALYRLQQIGDRQSVPLFAELLGSGANRNVRFHAIRGLANSRANESVAPLIEAVEGGDPRTKVVAARRLAEIGDRSAIPALQKAVRGARGPLRRARLRRSLELLER
jgi:HEAT repeat protein